MRVIDAFARALLEREAACDDGAFGGAQRIENGFFERGRPDVGSERLAVDGDVYTTSLFVDGDGDAVIGTSPGSDATPQEPDDCEESERRYRASAHESPPKLQGI